MLHLLYARFWHKVLYDLGQVSTVEPFQRLVNQGMVLAAAYADERGTYVEADEVVERDGEFFHDGEPVTREFGKMGKSLKNAVSPDDIYRDYGADTLRLYEMFTGPLDASRPWNTADIVGVHRFLQRLWRNVIDEATGVLRVSDARPDDETLRVLHRTIAAVRDDMASMSFNTAIARLFECNNHLTHVVARDGAAPPAENPRRAMQGHRIAMFWNMGQHRLDQFEGGHTLVDRRPCMLHTVERDNDWRRLDRVHAGKQHNVRLVIHVRPSQNILCCTCPPGWYGQHLTSVLQLSQRSA